MQTGEKPPFSAHVCVCASGEMSHGKGRGFESFRRRRRSRRRHFEEAGNHTRTHTHTRAPPRTPQGVVSKWSSTYYC